MAGTLRYHKSKFFMKASAEFLLTRQWNISTLSGLGQRPSKIGLLHSTDYATLNNNGSCHRSIQCSQAATILSLAVESSGMMLRQ